MRNIRKSWNFWKIELILDEINIWYDRNLIFLFLRLSSQTIIIEFRISRKYSEYRYIFINTVRIEKLFKFFFTVFLDILCKGREKFLNRIYELISQHIHDILYRKNLN
jgi:hypothetical protein